jgi:hypothetical protein
MLSRFTSRSSWWGRSTRACVAWLALLAVALPSFASVRGLCCEPGVTKSSDCCAAAINMPGMDSSRMNSSGMGSMAGVATEADHSVALTAVDCDPALESEIPAYLLRSEGNFDGSPLRTREIHSALVWNLTSDLSASGAPVFLLVEGRPPRISPLDPLTVILRI